MTPSPTTNAPANFSRPAAKTTSPIPRIIASPWTWLAALLLLLLILEPTPFEIKISGLSLDVWLQDNFYDFTTNTWLVPRKAPQPGWFIFYTGAKALVIIPTAVVLLALACFPKKFWRRRNLQNRWFARRRPILLAFAAIAIIPLACGIGKKHTKVYSPWNNTRYGGDIPYVRLFDKYPEDFKALGKTGTNAFPAGHASGGFALMSLAFLATSRRKKILLVLAGSAIGWGMGLYQMFRGAHYLSHTLVTWCLAALIITLLAKLLPKNIRDNSGVPSRATPGN